MCGPNSSATSIGGAAGYAGGLTPPKAEILDPKAAATATVTDPKAAAAAAATATQAGGPTGTTASTANAIAGANGTAAATGGGAAQAVTSAANLPGLEGILQALQAMVQQLTTLIQQLAGGGGAVQQLLTGGGATTTTGGANGDGTTTGGGGTYTYAPITPNISPVDQTGNTTQTGTTTQTGDTTQTGGAYGAGVDQNGNGIPDSVEQADPTPNKGNVGGVDANGDGVVDQNDDPKTTPTPTDTTTNGGGGVDTNGDGKVDDKDPPTTTPDKSKEIGLQLDQANKDLVGAQATQKTADADLKTANAAQAAADKLVTTDKTAVDTAQGKVDSIQKQIDAAKSGDDHKNLTTALAAAKQDLADAKAKLLTDSTAATKAGKAQDTAQSKADKAAGAVEALQKLIKELQAQQTAEAKKEADAAKKAADDKAKADAAAKKKAADDKAATDKAKKTGEKGDDKPKTYTVKAGDTLSAIGRQLGVDWHALYDANKDVIGGDPNLIKPGQVLKLPDGTTTTTGGGGTKGGGSTSDGETTVTHKDGITYTSHFNYGNDRDLTKDGINDQWRQKETDGSDGSKKYGDIELVKAGVKDDPYAASGGIKPGTTKKEDGQAYLGSSLSPVTTTFTWKEVDKKWQWVKTDQTSRSGPPGTVWNSSTEKFEPVKSTFDSTTKYQGVTGPGYYYWTAPDNKWHATDKGHAGAKYLVKSGNSYAEGTPPGADSWHDPIVSASRQGNNVVISITDEERCKTVTFKPGDHPTLTIREGGKDYKATISPQAVAAPAGTKVKSVFNIFVNGHTYTVSA